MQTEQNAPVAAHLIDPEMDILASYEAWTKRQKANIDILSQPIKAPIDLVLLYLAHPSNEDWYPSTKSAIKMIPTEKFKTEPRFIEELALYEASQGQKWAIVADTILHSQIYYDYLRLNENRIIVREIASAKDKNDLTWVVFYHIDSSHEGVLIRMEVFFIGFPKIGIQKAPEFLKKGLALVFTPTLVKGFKKLKEQAEAKAISNPSFSW